MNSCMASPAATRTSTHRTAPLLASHSSTCARLANAWGDAVLRVRSFLTMTERIRPHHPASTVKLHLRLGVSAVCLGLSLRTLRPLSPSCRRHRMIVHLLHRPPSTRRGLVQGGAFRRKLVIVGDGACGKTSLLSVFAMGEFPREYEPSTWNLIHGVCGRLAD